MTITVTGQTWRPRRRPLVLQTTLTDCAPACLAMVLAAHRLNGSLTQLREELGAGRDGVRLDALKDVALDYGLHSRVARVGADQLHRLPTPFLAHWNGDHFVVVQQTTSRAVHVADPALGRRRMSWDDFSAGYSDVVQVFEPVGGRPRQRTERPSAGVEVLFPLIARQWRPLVAMVAATAVLLVGGLAVPAATGAALIWLSRHSNLDGVWAQLALVLTGFMVTVTALSLVRGLAGAQVSEGIGRELTGSLVTRLMKSSLLFFEHRGRGDIIARVTATETVRDVVASRLVATVLDAVTAGVYLVILLVVDPTVGVVTVGAVAVELALLALILTRLRAIRREELLAEAKVHGWLLESVAGMAWLKAAGAEKDAETRFTVLHEERLRGLRRSGRLDARAETIATVFRMVGPILILIAASWSVTTGAEGSDVLTGDQLGRLVAVSALGAAALLPFGSVATNLHALQEIGSVFAHLGDLLQAPPEQATPGIRVPIRMGALAAEGIRFRHNSRAPWVLDGVDLRVESGQKLAIVGQSGSGKSTLARVLVGLYAPNEGSVTLDSHLLSELDLSTTRRQLGVVLQEPFLMTGSLYDNIALRHPQARPEDVIAAARAAEIHEDIMAMPNGYRTVVTESGVGLSGGQRQRLALARALLGTPRLLVLDEATSHVDPVTEARIEANLRSLAVTQVVIAHRMSTVRDADHILVLEAGRVVEEGTHDSLMRRNGRYAALASPQGAPR